MHRADDVYFSKKDAPDDLQQGDVVYYLEDESSKGPFARALCYLPSQEQVVSRVISENNILATT